jgi:hypothetical protein
LYCVARVRLEYRPPICVDFPVMSHSRAIGCEHTILQGELTIGGFHARKRAERRWRMAHQKAPSGRGRKTLTTVYQLLCLALVGYLLYVSPQTLAPFLIEGANLRMSEVEIVSSIYTAVIVVPLALALFLKR